MFQSYISAPSLTPDDDVFRHLALTYSSNHLKMSRGVSCKSTSPAFPRGITNGAAWYPLTGGMQDYNYIWYGCMETTLELSCCKYPPASELPKYWQDNKLALVKYLGEAHRGMWHNNYCLILSHTNLYSKQKVTQQKPNRRIFNVKDILLYSVKGIHGFVMDENGNPVEKASLKVKSRDVGFQSTKYGEFWRILLPGVYRLEVYGEGYVPKEVEVIVVEEHPTALNITLKVAGPKVGLH